MPKNTPSANQSGGINVDRSKIEAGTLVGRDLINVYMKSETETPKPLTPLEVISRAVEERELDRQIATNAQYYITKLSTWPWAQSSVGGEEIIEPLRALLKNVEGRDEFRVKNKNVWATLYRMLGGAYLIHTKLDMGDKLATAIPFLKQSKEIWPEQRGLAETIAFFETVLVKQTVQITDYLTNVLQVLRGYDDPAIAGLVESLAAGAQSPERQAQSWLLNEATPNPIWNFLQGLQMMIKNERGIDAQIEITSELLSSGHVNVQAKVGPNVLLWEVNYAAKTFLPKNELTQGFMGLIANA
jgi:hypothetical protein